MNDIYDIIYNILNPIVDSYKIHYPNKKNKVYPYCEFQFSNTLPNNEVSNNNLLQIDVWDNKSNSITEIEEITANIYNTLINKKIKTDDMFITTNRNNPCILILADPEIDIQRRELRFILTVYRNNMSI